MLKRISAIFIFLNLILAGCSTLNNSSRLPASKMTSLNCKRVLNQVRRLSNLNNDKSMNGQLRSGLWDWLNENSTKDIVDNYIDLVKINFNKEEMDLVTQPLQAGEQLHDRMNYLIWSGGQLPKKRKKAISELVYWDKPEQTKELKKFLNARKKFDKWEEKKIEDLLEEAGDGADEKVVRMQAKAQRQTYERLKYACSAKIPNKENAAAGKNFTRFLLTVGPTSVVAGYTVANWDELKIAWAQMQEGEGAPLKSWFKHLGYDLSIGIILNYTIGRIFSEPTGGYLEKVIKGYSADVAIGTVDMFAYNMIFSQNDSEIGKRFEALKLDPEFQEKLKLLKAQLDNVGFVAKFKKVLISKLKEIATQNYPISLNSSDLLNLSAEDLDKPEVQNLVLSALSAQLYFEGRYGAEAPEWSETLIQTGLGGSDRLLFYASIGPLYHSVNIAIGTRIYQTICMGKENLGQAFAKAALVQTLWAFSYSMFEFPMRSKLINQ